MLIEFYATPKFSTGNSVSLVVYRFTKVIVCASNLQPTKVCKDGYRLSILHLFAAIFSF